MKFICDSDLHFKVYSGNTPTIRPDKIANVSRIKTLDPDFVIVAGDLTNNGSDGKKLLCIPLSGPEKQLQGYVESYAKNLEQQDIQVYECMGNHDDWTYPPYMYMAVKKYIISKHKSLLYSFTQGDLLFICLNIYPDSDGRKFLRNTLKDKKRPVVIFFHYNLQGQWSNWWTDDDKKAFLEVISGYNVILIVTGHIHETNSYTWNGFQVVTCGGSKLVSCNYDNGKLDIELI